MNALVATRSCALAILLPLLAACGGEPTADESRPAAPAGGERELPDGTEMVSIAKVVNDRPLGHEVGEWLTGTGVVFSGVGRYRSSELHPQPRGAIMFSVVAVDADRIIALLQAEIATRAGAWDGVEILPAAERSPWIYREDPWGEKPD